MNMRFSVGARGLLTGACLAAAQLAAAWPGSAAAQDKAITVKVATATLNDIQHEWMKRFAAALEASAGGRVKTELYPASQLGSIPRMIESTQLGSIQVWVGPPEFLVGVDPRFEILSAPAVFQDDRQAERTIADPDFAKAFLAIGVGKGLVGVSLFAYGPTSVAMRTPARTLADFKGKKMRVLASPFQTEQFARLGATGVPLTLSDALPALQQGTIDGSFSTVPIFTTLQYQDAAKYITETGQSYVFVVATVSRRWFDGLPADLQEQVMAAARRAETEVTAWMRDFFAAQRKMWTAKGGELIALPDADKAELTAALATVGDDVVKAKPILRPLWDRLLATAKRGN